MTENIGRIYQIVCDTTNRRYIGSTTVDINHRLSQHVCRFNNPTKSQYSSCDIIKGGNYRIELLEEFKYENRRDLFVKEREWICKFTDCVNKQIPSRTKTEYRREIREKNKLYMREYYLRNKERIAIYNKEWRDKKK